MVKSKFLRKLAGLPEDEVPHTKEDLKRRFFKNLLWRNKKDQSLIKPKTDK